MKDLILKSIITFIVFILTIKLLIYYEFTQFHVGFFSCLMTQITYDFYENFIED
jgi:F0F1-type ATP synthase assembly protein I